MKEGPISEMVSPKPFLDLPFGPLVSVSSFDTFDEADPTTAIPFAASNFVIDTAAPYGRIALLSGSTWPTTILKPLNGIKIRAVFGFGEGYIPAIESPATPAVESLVPEDIQEAIKQMVAVTYEHRGDELPKIPANVAMLLEPYRRFKVGC